MTRTEFDTVVLAAFNEIDRTLDDLYNGNALREETRERFKATLNKIRDLRYSLPVAVSPSSRETARQDYQDACQDLRSTVINLLPEDEHRATIIDALEPKFQRLMAFSDMLPTKAYPEFCDMLDKLETKVCAALRAGTPLEEEVLQEVHNGFAECQNAWIDATSRQQQPIYSPSALVTAATIGASLGELDSAICGMLTERLPKVAPECISTLRPYFDRLKADVQQLNMYACGPKAHVPVAFKEVLNAFAIELWDTIKAAYPTTSPDTIEAINGCLSQLRYAIKAACEASDAKWKALHDRDREGWQHSIDSLTAELQRKATQCTELQHAASSGTYDTFAALTAANKAIMALAAYATSVAQAPDSKAVTD